MTAVCIWRIILSSLLVEINHFRDLFIEKISCSEFLFMLERCLVEITLDVCCWIGLYSTNKASHSIKSWWLYNVNWNLVLFSLFKDVFVYVQEGCCCELCREVRVSLDNFSPKPIFSETYGWEIMPIYTFEFMMFSQARLLFCAQCIIVGDKDNNIPASLMEDAYFSGQPP